MTRKIMCITSFFVTRQCSFHECFKLDFEKVKEVRELLKFKVIWHGFEETVVKELNIFGLDVRQVDDLTVGRVEKQICEAQCQ